MLNSKLAQPASDRRRRLWCRAPIDRPRVERLKERGLKYSAVRDAHNSALLGEEVLEESGRDLGTSPDS